MKVKVVIWKSSKCKHDSVHGRALIEDVVGASKSNKS